MPSHVEKRRIISFRMCDLFLNPWFLGVVVFGVDSLCKWIGFCFKIFFIFEVFINGEMILGFFPLHETFCESILFHFCYNNKKLKMLMV